MSKRHFRPTREATASPAYPTEAQFGLSRRTFIVGLAASALVGAQACKEAGADSAQRAAPVADRRLRGEPAAAELPADSGTAAPGGAQAPKPPAAGNVTPPPPMGGAPPMPMPQPDGGIEPAEKPPSRATPLLRLKLRDTGTASPSIFEGREIRTGGIASPPFNGNGE